jgi:hypothetical protein
MRAHRKPSGLKHSTQLNELALAYSGAALRQSELADRCESAVVKWQWFLGPGYGLDPLHSIGAQLRPGTPIEGEPDDPRAHHAYGFDGHGRIVAERQFVSNLKDRWYRTYFEYPPDRIRASHFHYAAPFDPINCSQLFRAPASDVQVYQRWAVLGWCSCEIMPQTDGVTRINTVAAQEDEPLVRNLIEIRSVDAKRIECWDRENGSPWMRTYRGPPPLPSPFIKFLPSSTEAA